MTLSKTMKLYCKT